MKVEEQFSSRERRELEALEESDKLPRITILENGPKGWELGGIFKIIKSIIKRL